MALASCGHVSECYDTKIILDAHSDDLSFEPASLRRTILLGSAESALTTVTKNQPLSLKFSGSAVQTRFMRIDLEVYNVAKVTAKLLDDAGHQIGQVIFSLLHLVFALVFY